ncbi:ROK family transcriptional regulator [Rathayibacter sp. VKM Ac-2760]|uniref:ROK family transcriptional regulator n=1 Tax=Rathayibacter sp. VKM Ac-2760 TaxID=2609253 RepID=UPI0013195481|nr:ROK family transcriptional regulator [Rathayibacter sp. VKM Ac-2760]QHC61041.1 ROK family protein [Rathayibacter sp. VKM Ac-2760]
MTELTLAPDDSASASQGRKANQRDTRHHNRGLVLRTLFAQDGLSRADLGRLTGLTKVTVSDLIADLIEDGIVEEVGQRPGSRAGKPATLLGVVAGGRCVVALDLSSSTHVRAALVDLRGGVGTAVVRELGTATESVDRVIDAALELLDAATATVVGIAVGTQGTVLPDGTVAEAPRLGWRSVRLRALLEKATGLPVVVQNDADSSALAERRYGGGAETLVLLQISSGVGAGVLIEGRVHTGPSSAAGEIGHVVVEDGGRACTCGNSGCLETYAAAVVLEEQIARDPSRTAEILGSAGGRIGAALAPVVGMLDLSEIVIAGPAALVEGPLLAAAAATVHSRTRSSFRPEVRIRASLLGENAVLLGAGAQLLREQLALY